MGDLVTAVRLNGGERIRPGTAGAGLTANLALEELPLPDPGPGEALIEPLLVGICGSDVHAALGEANFSWVPRPCTLGHEFSGRLVALGPGTRPPADVKVGDLVTAVAQRGCGDPRCRGCRSGRWNYCRRKKILGFHRDGALAQGLIAEADRLVALRYGLSPLQGAVVEPLSVVAQAVYRKLDLRPGMDVVVSGCGIIGMMAAELARASGARVAVTGLPSDRSVRLALAERRGFIPIVIEPERPLCAQLRQGVLDSAGNRFGDEYDEGTVDALIECSGAPGALADAPLSVRLEGSICVIATYPVEVPFPATVLTRGGQVMKGVMGSSRDDFETAQKLLRDGIFEAEEYATVYGLQDALKGFADSMTARVAKAVVEIRRS